MRHDSDFTVDVNERTQRAIADYLHQCVGLLIRISDQLANQSNAQPVPEEESAALTASHQRLLAKISA